MNKRNTVKDAAITKNKSNSLSERHKKTKALYLERR